MVTPSTFGKDVKEYVKSHKVLSVCTLGFNIIGYSIWKAISKAVSWIRSPKGSALKADSLKENIPKMQANKEISSANSIAGKMKKTEGIQTVNYNEASAKIKEQVRDLWPRRTESLSEHPDDQILCLVEGDTLIGAVSLSKKEDVADQPILKEKVKERVVFSLDIQISDAFQNKGHGRRLFEEACHVVTDSGGVVYLVDATDGPGISLYGGDKTRSQFDVSFYFKEKNGEYLLERRSGEQKELEYLLIPNGEEYRFYGASQSVEGMQHLVNYFKSHPSERYRLDANFFKGCERRLSLFQQFVVDEKEQALYAQLLGELKQLIEST